MKSTKVNSLTMPVYRDAGFSLDNAETTRKAFNDELDPRRSPELYIYSRYRNPTVVATEEQIMDLENCRWALLTQSGMSAIDLALSIFQKGTKTGKWLLFNDIYGGTNSFIDNVLIQRRGLDIHRFCSTGDRYDLGELERILKKLKPEMVYFEIISNPMLIVADGEAIIKLAKKYECTVIIDNTFATPFLWHPLEYGADLVIHSATKYLSGHGNLTAGVVCGNDSLLEKDAIEYRKYTGHMLSADDAYHLGTMLKTFEIRFTRHCENAMKLTGILTDHSIVEKVLYPGIYTHPTHMEAKKMFGERGYGGMITFDIAGKDRSAREKNRDQFIRAVADFIPLIPTMGDADTILLPVEVVWGDKYPLPGMIRLSVGIENIEKLEKAIVNALDSLNG